MSGFAICVIALALGQAETAPPEKPEQAEAAPAAAPSSAPTPTQTAPPTSTPSATPTPAPTSTSPATPTATPTPAKTPAATRTRPPSPAPAPALEPAAAPSPRPAQRSATPPAPAPSPAARTPAPPETPRAEPEREQALRAARAFLEALAASDPDALAHAASDRFSFDGEPQAGREAVRRRWREILAGRPGPAPRVNGVEVLAAQDAVARWGKPPARVAALARPGAWVAVGDVGGRPVVLFLAREGGRLAVLGMHD
jgi:hypothetical protein